MSILWQDVERFLRRRHSAKRNRPIRESNSRRKRNFSSQNPRLREGESDRCQSFGFLDSQILFWAFLKNAFTNKFRRKRGSRKHSRLLLRLRGGFPPRISHPTLRPRRGDRRGGMAAAIPTKKKRWRNAYFDRRWIIFRINAFRGSKIDRYEVGHHVGVEAKLGPLVFGAAKSRCNC